MCYMHVYAAMYVCICMSMYLYACVYTYMPTYISYLCLLKKIRSKSTPVAMSVHNAQV